MDTLPSQLLSLQGLKRIEDVPRDDENVALSNLNLN